MLLEISLVVLKNKEIIFITFLSVLSRKTLRKMQYQSDIKRLLRRNCEVENIMRFLRKTNAFEEIYKWWIADEISMTLERL